MSNTNTTPTHHSSAARLVLCVLACILLGLTVVTVLAVKKHRSTAAPTTIPVAAHVYDERVNSPNKTFQVVVDEGRLVKGSKTITVKQGDSVRVELRAVGEEARVQLEGYDIITENDPTDDVPGGFNFIADTKGVFNYYALSEPDADGNISEARTLLGSIVVE